MKRATSFGTRRIATERLLVAMLFLAPAAIVVGVLVGYPMVVTLWLSLHDANGSFVGAANYARMFSIDETRHAITNNIIWVVVAPTLVTALGLLLAVLTERIRWSTALRTILFMPMAISFLAVGVSFRLVYDENPQRGALNAALVAVHDAFKPPSKYYGAAPRDGTGLVASDGGYETAAPVPVGEPVAMPLVGLPRNRVPSDAQWAGPLAAGTELRGVVWLDFTRGGDGAAGSIDAGEVGLPGVRVEAVRDGQVVATAVTDGQGRFSFPDLTEGDYTVRLAATNFTEPFRGLTWLGPELVTPAVIGVYIWVWAGFAMLLISAGLAGLPRDVIEAARVDGASDWQVLRRVTVPLMRPILIVVLVTLSINVLKIFDLLYVLPPDSSQDEANVLAVEMYRVSFGGGLDYGLGSALAVLLFLLILPAMLFTIRYRRRREFAPERPVAGRAAPRGGGALSRWRSVVRRRRAEEEGES